MTDTPYGNQSGISGPAENQPSFANLSQSQPQIDQPTTGQDFSYQGQPSSMPQPYYPGAQEPAWQLQQPVTDGAWPAQQPLNPGEFNYHDPYSPKKKKTGLIIGVILGILILAGLGAGGFLFVKNKEDKSSNKQSEEAISPNDVTAACPLLTVSDISKEFDGGNIKPKEEKDKPQPKTGKRFGCTYQDSNGNEVIGFSITVYNKGVCKAEKCLNGSYGPDQKNISGVGNFAVAHVDQGTNVLMAVKIVNEHPIILIFSSPKEDLDSTLMAKYAKNIFQKFSV